MKDVDPRTEKQLDDVAEVRNSLRQTWPSLTDADIEDFPNDRSQAADLIRARTGAPVEEIETRLSELYGLDPARHAPDMDEGTDIGNGKKGQTKPTGERKSA